jgi:hypothetical protein
VEVGESGGTESATRLIQDSRLLCQLAKAGRCLQAIAGRLKWHRASRQLRPASLNWAAGFFIAPAITLVAGFFMRGRMGGMTSRQRRPFSWYLLTGLAISIPLWALLGWLIYNAQYAAYETAYGNQRMTRSEAEALASGKFMLSRLPDSEFLSESKEADGKN